MKMVGNMGIGSWQRGAVPFLLVVGMVLAACDRNTQQTPARDTPSMARTVQAELEKERLPGARLAHRKCATCHYLDRHLTKVGPSLKGVYGRAPTITGVPFKVWDEQALDQWLRDPTGIKPGTMMAIPGIRNAKDRKSIIEYLKQL